MTELRVGDQLIRFDRSATIAMYSQILRGDADVCGCSGCRNFAQLRTQAYPAEFKEFLATLGIDSSKESEAVHHGPEEDVHSYDVRFRFVGQLIETGERSVKLGNEFHYWIGTAVPEGGRRNYASLSKRASRSGQHRSLNRHYIRHPNL